MNSKEKELNYIDWYQVDNSKMVFDNSDDLVRYGQSNQVYSFPMKYLYSSTHKDIFYFVTDFISLNLDPIIHYEKYGKYILKLPHENINLLINMLRQIDNSVNKYFEKSKYKQTELIINNNNYIDVYIRSSSEIVNNKNDSKFNTFSNINLISNNKHVKLLMGPEIWINFEKQTYGAMLLAEIIEIKDPEMKIKSIFDNYSDDKEKKSISI